MAEESFDDNALEVANGVNPTALHGRCMSCDALIQPLFLLIKKAQVATIGTALRHDAPIVRLGVAPHTDALSLTIRKNRMAQP